MQTNYHIYLWDSDFPSFYSIEYSGCSCDESAACFSPAVMYNRNRNLIIFVVPGFHSECYIIESLLVSSLQCFYDKQCFDNLTYYVNSTWELNVTVLNTSLSTKFTPNSTVGEMIDELMVEQWNSTITFRKYYDEYKPSECIYTVGSRNDAIYIVTTLIGLFGGLMKILKLVVPRVIAL